MRKQKFAVYAACFSLALASITTPNFLLPYATAETSIEDEVTEEELNQEAPESTSEEDTVTEDITEETLEDTSESTEELTEDTSEESTEQTAPDNETTEEITSEEATEDSTEEITSEETTEDELVEMEMSLLMAPSPDATSIEINSQEDWDEFVALQPTTEDPDCVWSNTAGSIVYNGDENEITIQFNTDINIGTVSFTDGNTTTPTTIKLRTNNCSITNSTITVNDTLDINNISISDSAITFSLSGDRTINGVVLTNTDLLYLNNSPIIMTVNNCTFNNSHITVERAGGTLNISDTNFNENTKSIITAEQGTVTMTLANVVGTNCHYDFIHNESNSFALSSVDGLNISTNDSGLNGIFKKNCGYDNIYIGDLNNVTIDGFDNGIFLREARIKSSNLTVPTWDNLSISNFSDTGIYLLNTTCIPFRIKDSTIAGLESSNYGIHFKSSGDSRNNWEELYSAQYDKILCIDNCDISNSYCGVYGELAPALVKDSNIHNVNSGIRVSASDCAAIRCALTAKESPDNDSYGIANIGSLGCEICDCDITGFYVGAANIKPGPNGGIGGGGSVEAYGCKFIDNIKNGICGYCSTAVNCLFTGSTEIMFNGQSSPNSIWDCTFVGDGTNIGAEDYNVHLYVNYNGTIAKSKSFSEYSSRDLSLGKTEFSNFKIALNAPNQGGIEGGNGVYIHDCETGVSLTCGGAWNEHGSYHIKDCKNGVIYRNAYIGPGADSYILIENCDIGIQDDYDAENDISHSTWMTGTDVGNGFVIKNCDIGMYLHKNFSSNSNLPFLFEGNRIACILEEPRSQITFGANLTLKDNSEIGIKCKDLNGNRTNIRIDGNKMSMVNENQALNVEGIIILNESSWEAEGTDEYYLASPESYLKIYTPYMFTDYKMIFDMPDNGYQEGRLVAITTTQGYTDSFFTNKEGWIIVYKQSVDDSGESIDDSYEHYLTAGCLVTYDYATNGGTSMSGNVLGSEMYASTDVNYFSKWKFKKDNPIDLSPIAVKDGYEFVGWNTDPNATEGLTSLTAGTTNITLYAIYKTTKAVTYHAFNSNDDFTQNVDFYNNQTSVTSQLAPYGVATHDLYSFVGYVLDENESDLENNILSEGDDFDVSDNQLDVYCVYDTQSVLTYKDVDNSTITTDTTDIRGVSVSIATVVFRFILINHVPVDGYTFDGWLDSEGVMHDAGTQYIITDHAATVKAVESEIYVDSITVTPKESTILIGKTVALTATVTPDNALNKDIVWSVDDDSIATVNRNGVVTGVSVGEVTVTATNERSGKSDTATVKVIRAETKKPVISISDDYKVTLTAGEVTNDSLDKIFYRINEGEWQEYTSSFPVYKQFKVETYQTTLNERLESDIAMEEGTEYATEITAEYIGEDKFIGEDVTKPEVTVTVHYPNSPDEVVTDFNLIDYTIDDEGPNDVTVTYNEYPNDPESPTLTSTVTVEGKEAKTEKPSISVSDDCKVTLTPGEVTNDTLDKIYYRINNGEWQEYEEPFPVYKKYVVEAYQITKVRHVESDKVSAEGIEYATGITAEYIGDPKPVGEDVTKPEVIVTVHYPNSSDETVTDFNLIDYTIKVVGPNKVTVTYNEYPEDPESPTLTSTVTVEGIPVPEKEPETRIVTIKGILKYSDGTPIANKTIKLNSLAEIIVYGDENTDNTKNTAVGAAKLYETTTDKDGNYEFKDIYVGEYELSIWDGNTSIATCNITVSAPEKDDDAVNVTDKRDDVAVNYDISGDVIKINATITPPEEPIPTTEETPEPTTEEVPPATVETPKPEAPKTGDNVPVGALMGLIGVSGLGIFLLGKKRKTKKDM